MSLYFMMLQLILVSLAHANIPAGKASSDVKVTSLPINSSSKAAGYYPTAASSSKSRSDSAHYPSAPTQLLRATSTKLGHTSTALAGYPNARSTPKATSTTAAGYPNLRSTSKSKTTTSATVYPNLRPTAKSTITTTTAAAVYPKLRSSSKSGTSTTAAVYPSLRSQQKSKLSTTKTGATYPSVTAKLRPSTGTKTAGLYPTSATSKFSTTEATGAYPTLASLAVTASQAATTTAAYGPTAPVVPGVATARTITTTVQGSPTTIYVVSKPTTFIQYITININGRPTKVCERNVEINGKVERVYVDKKGKVVDEIKPPSADTSSSGAAASGKVPVDASNTPTQEPVSPGGASNDTTQTSSGTGADVPASNEVPNQESSTSGQNQESTSGGPNQESSPAGQSDSSAGNSDPSAAGNTEPLTPVGTDSTPSTTNPKDTLGTASSSSTGPSKLKELISKGNEIIRQMKEQQAKLIAELEAELQQLNELAASLQ